MKPTIVVSEDGMFSSQPMPITEIANLFCAALTGAVQDIRPSYSQNKDKDKIDKELFDCLNYSFSKCLELTFPEYELHPEITEEVIKKENELIHKRFEALEPTEPTPAEVIPITLEVPEDDKENFTKKDNT